MIEIKSWVLALVRSGRLELEANKYEIIDPYNMASVAPKGRLRVRPLSAIYLLGSLLISVVYEMGYEIYLCRN